MSTDLKQVNKVKKKSRRNDNRNEPKFTERLIKISRVSKVTKGGKKLSFRAIVVIGDDYIFIEPMSELEVSIMLKTIINNTVVEIPRKLC